MVIGLPVAVSNAIIPIALGVVSRIIIHYGPGAIAGFGVATRIEAFGLTPIFRAFKRHKSVRGSKSWSAKNRPDSRRPFHDHGVLGVLGLGASGHIFNGGKTYCLHFQFATGSCRFRGFVFNDRIGQHGPSRGPPGHLDRS